MRVALTPVASLALATGLVVVGGYLITAAYRKKKAEMPSAFHVFASTVGAVAAGGTFVHMAMDVTLTTDVHAEKPDLAASAASSVAAECVNAVMSLDETIIFCLGALGIIWCSCQILRREFDALLEAKP